MVLLLEIVIGTASALGIVGGVSALVLYRKNGGNGHVPEPPPKPPPIAVEEPQLPSLLAHITDRLERSLAALPEQVDASVELAARRLANAMEAHAAPEPAWPADLERNIERLGERLEIMERERAARLERLAEGLATVAQTPPVVQMEPPVVEMPPEVTRRIENLIAHISRLLQPMMRTQPPEPLYTPHGPITRAPGPVQLDLFNTIALQDNELVELVPPERDIYVASVFNLGPGNLFMKGRDDLFIDDPLATTVPAGSGDNGIPCARSLFVIAEDGCKISLRLNQ